MARNAHKWTLTKPLAVGICFAFTTFVVKYISHVQWTELLEADKLAILRAFPPRSLPQLLQQRDALLVSASRHPIAVLLAWAFTYVSMQTFAIPGTISLSLLAGALYGPLRAWLLVAVVSTAGSCSAYALGNFVGRPLVTKMWPGKLGSFAAEVSRRRQSLFRYIVFLRITPLLPNTFINVASPIVGVPLKPFFWGTLLGCLPNNWVAVSAGSRLGELSSLSELVDVRLALAGLAVGLLMLALPALHGTTPLYSQ